MPAHLRLMGVAAAVGLMLTPAAWAGPRGAAVLAFDDAVGDATTSGAPQVPTYGGPAMDLLSVRLETTSRVLRVAVTTAGRPAVAPFSGYDVTMRALRTCPGTVNDGAHPFEIRLRSDASGAPHAIFRGCRAQVSVPLRITGTTMTAAAPLSAFPNLRNTTADSVAAYAGFTDGAFDGLMRASMDSAAATGSLPVP